MADLDQRIQALRLFPFHAGLFVGTAYSAVIAQRAGARLWSGRQESFFDRSVDCFEHTAEACARFVVERYVNGRKIAALGTEKEPSRFNGVSQ